MKTKTIKRIIILLLLVISIIYFIILPVVKWNLSYDLSVVNTPEKTIEYFFSALSERNPKKAIGIYPQLKDFDDVNTGVFSLDFLISCKIEKTTDVTDKELKNKTSDERLFLVDYKIHYLFGISPGILGPYESGEQSLIFRVSKDNLTGIWYIEEAYPSAI